MGDPLDGRSLCHINLARGYRGGERQSELLITELARRGVRQQLVHLPGNPLRERCQAIGGLGLTEVKGRAFGASLAARRYDILHAHEAKAFYAALLANLVSGKPYVLTRRVPNPQRPSLARRIAYARAGCLAGVSHAVANNVHRLYPSIDVQVVPDAHASLPSNEAAATAIRDRFPGKVLIGHVGALDDSHKGQRTLLAVARRASVERPDWQFVFCGDGKDEAVLRAEAADLENVVFAGFVDNPGDYLASFDIFAFPSNFEALGSSLLDALYFGLPVVASDVGGIPEFIEDGVNGFLVAAGDADAMFNRIEHILIDAAMRASMAAANREKAARYDASAMADAYLEIYRGLL